MKPLDIYDKLRQAHGLVKDVLYDDDFNKLPEEMKNAIEGVHSVLYMAEKEAVQQDNEPPLTSQPKVTSLQEYRKALEKEGVSKPLIDDVISGLLPQPDQPSPKECSCAVNHSRTCPFFGGTGASQ